MALWFCCICVDLLIGTTKTTDTKKYVVWICEYIYLNSLCFCISRFRAHLLHTNDQTKMYHCNTVFEFSTRCHKYDYIRSSLTTQAKCPLEWIQNMKSSSQLNQLFTWMKVKLMKTNNTVRIMTVEVVAKYQYLYHRCCFLVSNMMIQENISGLV